MEQRQAKELADLEKVFGDEKRVVVDGELAKLDEKHLEEKEDLKHKHEQEYQALEG